MPPGKRRQSNAMLYTLITFVGLFIVATTVAVIYYVKAEELRTTTEEAQSELSKMASADEVRRVGDIVGTKLPGQSNLGSMLEYFNQIAAIVMGRPVQVTSAEVNAGNVTNAFRSLVEQTRPYINIGAPDPNATAPDLAFDLTVIAYECEEVDSQYNGLGHLAESDPEWLRGDLALLGEPSGAIIEAGCQGTLRVRVTTRGARAHSARGWLGDNAAHKLGPVLDRIAEWESREVDIDGCVYREGLNVVKLESFLATNIIPDEAHALVNYRFAPDLTEAEALGRVEKHLDGFEVTLEDSVPGALPGLDQPAAAALIDAVGEVRAKYGWTDVARFAQLGVPAVNFGPGDPSFAHRVDEQVPVEHITRVSAQLGAFLSGRAGR